MQYIFWLTKRFFLQAEARLQNLPIPFRSKTYSPHTPGFRPAWDRCSLRIEKVYIIFLRRFLSDNQKVFSSHVFQYFNRKISAGTFFSHQCAPDIHHESETQNDLQYRRAGNCESDVKQRHRCLPAHKIRNRYPDKKCRDHTLQHNKTRPADPVVKTEETEKDGRQHAVNSVCFQVVTARSCHTGNGPSAGSLSATSARVASSGRG